MRCEAIVKQGAILVNMARGDLVENLDILFEYLDNGRLGGVGLDVFPDEPPKNIGHPIFSHPNFIATPHILGMTFNSNANIHRSMARDMVAILGGKKPRFVVNPEVLGSLT